MATPKPAGEWVSPITSSLLTSKAIQLSSPRLDEHGRLFWLEGRPSEGGRQVLVMRDQSGSIQDITPGPDSGLNVRTTVHEYGGGDYVVMDLVAYFSNFKDQRVYRQEVPLSGPAGSPTALTEEGLRFADYAFDSTRQRLLAVAEKHDTTDPNSHKVDNFLVATNARSGAVTTLTRGHDFYSSPRVSPGAGTHMAWIAWDFPQMPWDGTLLMVADVQEDGSLSNETSVAGGVDESVQQPVWSADGSALYYISDKTGWWNLYRYSPKDNQASLVYSLEVEFGFPLWTFGTETYQVLPNNDVIALYKDPQEAGVGIGVLTPGKGLTKLKTPYTYFGAPSKLATCLHGDRLTVAAVVGGPKLLSRVALLEAVNVEDLSGCTAEWTLIRSSAADLQVDTGYLSVPESVAFPTDDGKTAHMLVYPPTNKDFKLPHGQLPPLAVRSHGGPTSAAKVALDLNIQYLTSRGFAVADVDYGGSTGYGREYRNRLRGSWGIVDVADCCNAALHLSRQGQADAQRLCIYGGSAGGFTTLACLAFRSTFAAGASLYGVADLEGLAKDTHKFESRYLDTMVGPYPERKDLYVERAPIHHVDGFKAPVIFFQGDEDRIVTPDQAIRMHAAVNERGLPTALLMFQGEQHGFRKAENIRLSLDGMLYFWGKVLGYEGSMPKDLPAFPIDNLAVST